MIRKGLLVSALAAGALMGMTPAQASTQFTALGGIVNQLHENGSLAGNNFSYTYCQNGTCQTLFTGVSGLAAFNSDPSAIAGFNSMLGTSSYGSGAGYFDDYRFTFTGVGGFFGSAAPPPATPAAAAPMAAFMAPSIPIPEPGTWAMMILGFGFIGLAMRRRAARASFV
ncbi:MAG TPA: PEPxxWA-CTERM sorting domain-containing protein [Sphingobium sp.]|nr:PEPxxWA-CTERM sorting domain-containing protein [Sphingobium sp.]